MKTLIALLLLCSVAYADKKIAPRFGSDPAPLHKNREPTMPVRGQVVREPVFTQVEGILEPLATSYTQRTLTEKEYQLAKKRFAEWQRYKRAAARAGNRSSGVTTHNAYQDAAMKAVRSVQGR